MLAPQLPKAQENPLLALDASSVLTNLAGSTSVNDLLERLPAAVAGAVETNGDVESLNDGPERGLISLGQAAEELSRAARALSSLLARPEELDVLEPRQMQLAPATVQLGLATVAITGCLAEVQRWCEAAESVRASHEEAARATEEARAAAEGMQARRLAAASSVLYGTLKDTLKRKNHGALFTRAEVSLGKRAKESKSQTDPLVQTIASWAMQHAIAAPPAKDLVVNCDSLSGSHTMEGTVGGDGGGNEGGGSDGGGSDGGGSDGGGVSDCVRPIGPLRLPARASSSERHYIFLPIEVRCGLSPQPSGPSPYPPLSPPPLPLLLS